MEELLIVIFQFIFEILLQVLAELPWDLFLGSRPTASQSGVRLGPLDCAQYHRRRSHRRAIPAGFPHCAAALGHCSHGQSDRGPDGIGIHFHSILRRSPSPPATRQYRSNFNISAPSARRCFTFALALIRFTVCTSRPCKARGLGQIFRRFRSSVDIKGHRNRVVASFIKIQLRPVSGASTVPRRTYRGTAGGSARVWQAADPRGDR